MGGEHPGWPPAARSRAAASLPLAERAGEPAGRTVPGAPPGEPARAAIVAAGTFGVAFAAAMISIGVEPNRHPLWVLAVADAIGLSFLAAGLVVWWQRPANAVGKLMVAGGTLWYVGGLQATGNPALAAVGYWLSYLPSVVVSHAALAYPDGRLRRPAERWAVAASYLSYLLLQGLRYLLEGHGHEAGWQGPRTNTVWGTLVGANGVLFSAALFCCLVQRLRAASGPARRVHAPVWLTTLFLPVLVAASVAVSGLHLPEAIELALLLCYGLCLVGLPFAFLSGMLRVRLARQRVADLVVALQESVSPSRLRDLLATALGDPSLVLGFWSATAGGYVDAAGRPVLVPPAVPAAGPGLVVPVPVLAAGPGRAFTVVERPGQQLAVLVYDASLADQQALVRATVAAARLALENARLQALLQARLTELAESRARLAEAALTERRAIERDLHDGLQHRLLRLTWLARQAADAVGTGGARPLVDDLAAEAREAYVTLRELAAGIHPAILTEQGLRAAVEEHALRSPVPLLVDLPAGRCAAAAEATAFFVVLEAATNAVKHAEATRITVRGWRAAGRLTVEIADDGRGGADPGRGTGLRGLHDRVAALDGTLSVHSPAGHGTRVVVELPCG